MIEKVTIIYKALSDINRIRILKALQFRVLCVCEIRELLGLATSTVSQHLSVLKEADFIFEEKDGKWTNYKINYKSTDPRIPALLSTLDFWTSNSEIFTKDKQLLVLIDRKIICGT